MSTTSTDLAPVRVAVMTVVTTATVEHLVNELKRDAIQVETVYVDTLQLPPALPVYVVSLDSAIARVLSGRIVAWAHASELRPGLIGMVGEGGTAECEELLAAGFDDVVVPPISVRELARRVRAVHRRVHWKQAPNGRLRFGELTLDLFASALWVNGRTIGLTSIELAVIRALIKAHGRALSRTELLDAAWGEGDLEVSERAVDNVVLRLRRKLPRPELIETVRGVGFRLASQGP